MTDLQFDHTKDDLAESMGIKMVELKRFALDVEEYMSERKGGNHSVALDFVWRADRSFEMKILMTFTLGGMMGANVGGGPQVIMGKMSDLPAALLKKLKEDGLL